MLIFPEEVQSAVNLFSTSWNIEYHYSSSPSDKSMKILSYKSNYVFQKHICDNWECQKERVSIAFNFSSLSNFLGRTISQAEHHYGCHDVCADNIPFCAGTGIHRGPPVACHGNCS